MSKLNILCGIVFILILCLFLKIHKIIKKIIGILLCIFCLFWIIFIISFFWGSDTYHLGGDYYFMSKDASIDMGYPNGNAVIYKSRGPNYYDHIFLEGNILNVDYDENFIIGHIREKNLDQCYLINKNTQEMVGPFSVEEYGKEMEILGVSKKLKCIK